MGSFILRDDYRLPDIASFSFKKESSNSPTRIFENNPCFANIKKELGFQDEALPATEAQPDNRMDYVPDTKARFSPVVERLILQEIQNDIVDYASMLQIAIDPEFWSVEDVRTWLVWVSEQYQLGNLSDCLAFDGPSLCNMSEQELVLLTGSQDSGLKVAAQLDIWKNACRMVPSAGFHLFQQQQAMDHRFGNETRMINNAGPKLMASSCSYSLMPPTVMSQTEVGPCLDGYQQQTINYASSSPYMRQHMRQQSAPAFPDSNGFKSIFPRQTIPPDRYHSQRVIPPPVKFSQPTLPPQLVKRTVDESFMPAPNVPAFSRQQPLENPFHTEIKEAGTNGLKRKHVTSYPNCTATTEAVHITPTNSDNIQHIKEEKKHTNFEEDGTDYEPPAKKSNTGNGKSQKKSSKHPIHLWEFLKQLLQEKKDCIQWVDEEKGVFKILNSQQVAKSWGERKNRPAMNYDKLSRSIRQYYKKGIIKKTTQGKRLVYQFCESYL